ncbi:MAG: DUF1491 family protein [Hyphomonadaceae bacterium]|nr:DUF1491 family protein [Hyphomonadaceae bacterium]
MFDERLPTRVWVDALMRRAQVAGASAFVLQRGEESRGDVLIKVADLSGGARAYVPRTSMEGTRVFVDLETQGVGPEEAGVDEYVGRARDRDRDLWVIEIEDREARHFLTEPVE